MSARFVLVLVLAVSGSKAESEKKLQQAASDYAMTIDIAGPTTKADSGITCAPMTSTHVTIALPLFLPELKRYPKDFFTGAGIERMVLCGELTRGGQAWGGLAVGNGTFYLNLKNANVSAAHAARTFHHEVFHLVDEIDDKEWSSISGGFISDYAKTSPVEDRAELYSEMMVNSRGVAKKASGNSALERKQKLVESFVQKKLPGVQLR